MYAAYQTTAAVRPRHRDGSDQGDDRTRWVSRLTDPQASEQEVRDAWDWYLEHDGFTPRPGDLGDHVLAHPACPPEVLDEAVLTVRTRDVAAMARIAGHARVSNATIDSCAHETLMTADDDGGADVDGDVPTVFANPRLARDFLEEGSQSSSARIRADVAVNPKTSAALLRRMADREVHPRVIAALRSRFERLGDEQSLILLSMRDGHGHWTSTP